MPWFKRHPFFSGVALAGACMLAMIVLFQIAGASGTDPGLSGVYKLLGLAVLAVPVLIIAAKVARGSKAEVASRRRCSRCSEDLTDIPGAASCPNCGLPLGDQPRRG